MKDYEGFTAPDTQTVTIKEDGTLAVNYYYTRNSYTVTLNKGTGIASVIGNGTYKYGASVTINAVVEDGYAWADWTGTHNVADQQYTFDMPASNVVDTANAEVAMQAYAAVYGGTNLVFGKAASVPTTYNGMALTESWAGIESLQATSENDIPWHANYKDAITDVKVLDEIKPVSTAYWFYDLKNAANINVAKLNTESVTNMKYIFGFAGNNATTFNLVGLDNWNTASVTNMSWMFWSAGNKATSWSIGDLSGWDTASVTDMGYMFGFAGNKATSWSIGNLSGWNTANVTNMDSMFYQAGYTATSWSPGDLSGWNTSNVTTMEAMFGFAGYTATSWSIGDLSGWNTANVTDMANMFYYAGSKASYYLNLSGWNVSKVTYHDSFNTGVLFKVRAPKWVN